MKLEAITINPPHQHIIRNASAAVTHRHGDTLQITIASDDDAPVVAVTLTAQEAAQLVNEIQGQRLFPAYMTGLFAP